MVKTCLNIYILNHSVLQHFFTLQTISQSCYRFYRMVLFDFTVLVSGKKAFYKSSNSSAQISFWHMIILGLKQHKLESVTVDVLSFVILVWLWTQPTWKSKISDFIIRTRMKNYSYASKPIKSLTGRNPISESKPKP